MPVAASNKTNRLIHEKSPYLLQHAHNPVDWYPWGEEAIEKAKREDKPVFLSIGYSTCHWCHVMERETFEDADAAKVLNDSFVCIKVDREERPDIDHVYMEVCQAMTGSGGWPLSVFMDPDKRPFFAGTYFTNAQFQSLCAQVRRLWDSERGKLNEAAGEILKHLQTRPNAEGAVSEDLPQTAYAQLKKSFDPIYGGFSQAPKFPSPHILLFLMEYADAHKTPAALDMAAKTLEGMYRGGMHDHIGYGFCRYSTDKRWLAPHFEKMLYDNALLALTYAKAYRITQKEIYAKTARTTLGFLQGVMRSPEGGFYTALDADSEGVEGKFYLWTREEVNRLLGERATEFCSAYDISQEGNFEGNNIPNLIGNPLKLEDLPGFDRERILLFATREKRVHPFLDDKILTCWNGLCMAAFAYAGRALEENTFTETAAGIWRFIRSQMIGKDNGLLSTYREGEAKHAAHADDYAYLIWGLVELYEATWDFEYLSSAIRLNGEFLDRFADRESGGFFFTGRDAEQLIARIKTVYDGAAPSANSVQAMNLLRLSDLTGDIELRRMAEEVFQAFAAEVSGYPAAFAHMVHAMLAWSREQIKVVLIGRTKNDLEEMMRCLRGVEGSVAVIAQDEKIPENLEKYFAEYHPRNGRPAAYVCRGRMCLPPVTGAEELRELLEEK